MTIAIPNINDLQEIDKIAVQVHEFHVNWRPDIFESTDTIISADELKQMIDNKEIIVAKKNNRVVGYVILYSSEGKKKGYRYRKQLEVAAMGIDKDYRNQKIGTQLLEYIKAYALENGYTDLRLTVNEENANAIHLYEKVGFKVKNIAYSCRIK